MMEVLLPFSFGCSFTIVSIGLGFILGRATQTQPAAKPATIKIENDFDREEFEMVCNIIHEHSSRLKKIEDMLLEREADKEPDNGS